MSQVYIEIKDINDHQPTFKPDHLTFKLREDVPLGYQAIDLPPAIDLDDDVLSVQYYRLLDDGKG